MLSVLYPAAGRSSLYPETRPISFAEHKQPVFQLPPLFPHPPLGHELVGIFKDLGIAVVHVDGGYDQCAGGDVDVGGRDEEAIFGDDTLQASGRNDMVAESLLDDASLPPVSKLGTCGDREINVQGTPGSRAD